jgi:hypothetical protein
LQLQLERIRQNFGISIDTHSLLSSQIASVFESRAVKRPILPLAKLPPDLDRSADQCKAGALMQTHRTGIVRPDDCDDGGNTYFTRARKKSTVESRADARPLIQTGVHAQDQVRTNINVMREYQYDNMKHKCLNKIGQDKSITSNLRVRVNVNGRFAASIKSALVGTVCGKVAVAKNSVCGYYGRRRRRGWQSIVSRARVRCVVAIRD